MTVASKQTKRRAVTDQTARRRLAKDMVTLAGWIRRREWWMGDPRAYDAGLRVMLGLATDLNSQTIINDLLDRAERTKKGQKRT